MIFATNQTFQGTVSSLDTFQKLHNRIALISSRNKIYKFDFINTLRGEKIKNHKMPASVMLRKNANWDSKS